MIRVTPPTTTGSCEVSIRAPCQPRTRCQRACSARAALAFACTDHRRVRAGVAIGSAVLLLARALYIVRRHHGFAAIYALHPLHPLRPGNAGARQLCGDKPASTTESRPHPSFDCDVRAGRHRIWGTAEGGGGGVGCYVRTNWVSRFATLQTRHFPVAEELRAVTARPKRWHGGRQDRAASSL